MSAVGYSLNDGPVQAATGTAKWSIKLPNTLRVGQTCRLRIGILTNGTLSQTSEIEFIVGRNKDVNGDGYADSLVGAYLTPPYGAAFLYYGTPGGLGVPGELPPTQLVGPSTNPNFGMALTVGDWNGDGFSDAAVSVGTSGAHTPQTDPRTVFVYLSSNAGLSTTPIRLTGPVPVELACQYRLESGDINGDGYDDLVVGYEGYGFFTGSTSVGIVQVFYGSAKGLATTPVVVGGANRASFTHALRVGDTNGDGFVDIVVKGNDGVISIYQGSPSGLATTPAIQLSPPPGMPFGSFIAMGILSQHLAITTSEGGSALLYEREGDHYSSTPTLLSAGPAMGWAEVDMADVDLDGFDDVFVADPCRDVSCQSGSISLFKGSSSGVNSTAALTIHSLPDHKGFGAALSIGDINGDGRPDLLAGTGAHGLTLFHGAWSTIYPTSPTKIISLGGAFGYNLGR